MKTAIENQIYSNVEHPLAKSFLISKRNVENYWVKNHSRHIFELFNSLEKTEYWAKELNGDVSKMLAIFSEEINEAKANGVNSYFSHEKIIELWEKYFFEIIAYLPFGTAFYFITYFPANFKNSLTDEIIKSAIKLKDKDEVLLFLHRLSILNKSSYLAKLWTDIDINEFLQKELKKIEMEE